MNERIQGQDGNANGQRSTACAAKGWAGQGGDGAAAPWMTAGPLAQEFYFPGCPLSGPVY
jgi:hypothetical protein